MGGVKGQAELKVSREGAVRVWLGMDWGKLRAEGWDGIKVRSPR